MSQSIQKLIDQEDPVIIVVSPDEEKLKHVLNDIISMAGDDAEVVESTNTIPRVIDERKEKGIVEPFLVTTKIAQLGEFAGHDFTHLDYVAEEGASAGVIGIIGIVSDMNSVKLAQNTEGITKWVLARSALFDIDFAEKMVRTHS